MAQFSEQVAFDTLRNSNNHKETFLLHFDRYGLNRHYRSTKPDGSRYNLYAPAYFIEPPDTHWFSVYRKSLSEEEWNAPPLCRTRDRGPYSGAELPIERNDFKMLQIHIDRSGVNSNYNSGGYPVTLLSLAIKKENDEVRIWLEEKGAKCLYYFDLQDAIKKQDACRVKYLIETCGANPHDPSHFKAATKVANRDIILCLLINGTNVGTEPIINANNSSSLTFFELLKTLISTRDAYTQARGEMILIDFFASLTNGGTTSPPPPVLQKMKSYLDDGDQLTEKGRREIANSPRTVHLLHLFTARLVAPFL